MKRVGFVGWRGMVGSVLLDRMKEEGDFSKIDPHFFSTSQNGHSGTVISGQTEPIGDANDIQYIYKHDIIIT